MEEEQSETAQCSRVLYIVVPPDGGWGWVIVIGAFFSFLIADGIIYTYGIFLNDMSESFNCSKSNIVFTGAIMIGIFCLTGPFTSALVNKFGFRKITICGSFLGSISCILTAASSSLYLTYITFGFIGGIGFGMIYLSSIIVVGFYFERWRALATAIAVCGAGIGGIVLPIILTILLDEIGWRNTFKVMSILSLLCIFFGASYKPLKPVPLETDMHKNSDYLKAEKKGFFNKYHNTSHPTVSDIHSTSHMHIVPELPESAEIIYKITEHESQGSFNSSIKSTETIKPVSPRQSLTSLTIAEFSQLSTVHEELETSKCFCINYLNSKRNNINARPLYRDDIFYKASVHNLPAYQKSGISLQYTMHVTRTITQKELNEKKHSFYSESIKRTLATMLDMRLLSSPSFLLFTISGILTALGFYTPYMFIKDRSIQNGLSNQIAFWLISCIGVTNTLGRIICGIISSIYKDNSITICYISLFVGGLATIFSGFSYNIWIQFGYAAVYGYSIACISTLRTIIIVEILGLENLTNAIGIFLMFQGIASLIGTAISAILRDSTGEYNYTFYFAGSCLLLSSLFMLPIKKVSAWEKQRRSNK